MVSSGGAFFRFEVHVAKAARAMEANEGLNEKEKRKEKKKYLTSSAALRSLAVYHCQCRYARVLRGAAGPFLAYVGALFSFLGGGAGAEVCAPRPAPRTNVFGFAFMFLQ